MAERTHALISPSASSRWLHCAGSVAANAGPQVQGRSNFYADEGTAAHSLLELCLKLDVPPENFLGVHIYLDYVVTEEMADAVGHALDWLRAYLAQNPKATFHSEHWVSAGKLLVFEGESVGGTGDIFVDNAPVELVAVDYKHGAGVAVEVDGNTQTLLYLLLYYWQHATRPYKQYRHIIIQPRSRHEDGPVREERITHAELMAFAKHVQARVKHIAKHPNEREAGTWCRWCAAAGTCRALADYSLRAAQLEFGSGEAPIDPDAMNAEEMAYALHAAPVIEQWIKALYGAALNFMLSGGEIDDMKLVHSRTSRYWDNEKEVMKLLKRRFELDAIAPRSMLGVPGIEKLFKQAKKPMPAALATHIARSRPTIHIAPADDPRPAVTRGEEFSPLPAKGKKK